MVELELILNHFISGKGIWKFNNSLLFIPTYVELVNKIINEEKLKYAVLVYNLYHIINTSDKIEMTIKDDTFLEILFLRIHRETIKFSTTRKKLSIQLENTLLNDIETLEASESQLNTDLIEDKKKELDEIRNNKLKGNMVRSRLQWLHEGEKPSKFFVTWKTKTSLKRPLKRYNSGMDLQ